MISLLNSVGLQTGVAALVGVIAIFLYWRQKKDKKIDAARSIILEIQGAEKSIGKIREAVKKGHLDVDVSVLQSESWSKVKILFVRDFDSDEWDLISDFYNKAALIDEAIRYNKTSFASDVEQIRMNKQATLARYAAEAIDKANGKNTDEIREEYDLKSKTFDMLYMDKQGDYMYSPVKPVNDVKMYLDGLSNMSTTTIGQKLKQLAHLKK